MRSSVCWDGSFWRTCRRFQDRHDGSGGKSAQDHCQNRYVIYGFTRSSFNSKPGTDRRLVGTGRVRPGRWPSSKTTVSFQQRSLTRLDQPSRGLKLFRNTHLSEGIGEPFQCFRVQPARPRLAHSNSPGRFFQRQAFIVGGPYQNAFLARQSINQRA